MSTEHDVTYKWAIGTTSIQATRQIVGAVSGSIDVSIPSGTYRSPASFGLTLAKALSIFLLSDQPVAFMAGGVNAIQSVAITGTPTGGTFSLTFGAQTTTAMAYNSTATQVQAALNLLSSIEAGGVAVSGGPLPGTPLAVTFLGMNGLQVVAAMTHADSLTGGTAPAVAVATTTAGVAPDTTKNLLAGVPLVWDSAAYFAQPFAADIATIAITNTSGVGAHVQLRTLSNA